jgi:translation initiation factor IF-3
MFIQLTRLSMLRRVIPLFLFPRILVYLIRAGVNIGGTSISKENQINEEIRDRELRVIDSDGTQLGILSLEAALALSVEKKLDLVNIAPKATPPVCKILDYGKFRYDMQKREKEVRKKQRTIQIKEIRLSTFIEEHDLSVKANNALKFLKEGDKVKVSLRFRGREKDYASKGIDVMNKFAGFTSEAGIVERKAEFEGRSLIMVLSPRAEK